VTSEVYETQVGKTPYKDRDRNSELRCYVTSAPWESGDHKFHACRYSHTKRQRTDQPADLGQKVGNVVNTLCRERVDAVGYEETSPS